ncbi:MAG: M20 family metallopeptidase [Pseudomonadota bacterium]|nr:M20 family metallopeptidase [Pseudomonadota bacterium]
MTTRADCLADAAAQFDEGQFLADLQRRVALRTESDQGTAPPALTQYLQEEMRQSLAPLGFDCQVLPNPQPGAGPLLVARRVQAPDLPTVLTYGHGDVVSGQDSQWRQGLQPWAVTVEGQKWYGRGTADNKGQHTINLMGLAAAIRARQGRLGYNVTVLMETGEEAGSPGLKAFCAQHAQLLKADVLLACDGPRLQAQRPTLFLGSRGAVNFTLRVQSRQRAYHSGNWGGVLSNPATRLAHALGTLVSARGQLLVPGLRPPPMSAAVKRALADLPIGGGPDDPALDADWGEPGLSPAERLMGWNTLEVLALGCGSAQRPVNAIAPEALAHCQLRFVVGTPWQQLQSMLRAHLDQHGFSDVQIELGMQGAASRLEPDHPWVRWASASIERSSGQAPHVLPNLAGSLPNDIFADLLGLPTLWVPHSYPACAQHAPNEHLLASVAREGLQIMAGLYWDLGEPQSAPWPKA